MHRWFLPFVFLAVQLSAADTFADADIYGPYNACVAKCEKELASCLKDNGTVTWCNDEKAGCDQECQILPMPAPEQYPLPKDEKPTP